MTFCVGLSGVRRDGWASSSSRSSRSSASYSASATRRARRGRSSGTRAPRACGTARRAAPARRRDPVDDLRSCRAAHGLLPAPARTSSGSRRAPSTHACSARRAPAGLAPASPQVGVTTTEVGSASADRPRRRHSAVAGAIVADRSDRTASRDGTTPSSSPVPGLDRLADGVVVARGQQRGVDAHRRGAGAAQQLHAAGDGAQQCTTVRSATASTVRRTSTARGASGARSVAEAARGRHPGRRAPRAGPARRAAARGGCRAGGGPGRRGARAVPRRAPA